MKNTTGNTAKDCKEDGITLLGFPLKSEIA
jgi:hypothetical protein